MEKVNLTYLLKVGSAVIGGVAALLSVYWIGYEVGQNSHQRQKEVIAGEYVCKNQNPILIISLKGKTDQRGIEIINALNKLGCKSSGPVKPPNEIVLSQSDIRYFHKSDLEDAIALADYIRELTGINCKIKALMELGYKVPKRSMEVWLK